MQYKVLYNAPPWNESKTESCFIDADSVKDCIEKFSEDHSYYHYTIFLDGKNLRKGSCPRSLKDKIKDEDIQKYQNRLKKEQQERIQRVRSILKQHDIEIEIRTGYHVDDNEITFGFVYQGEMIMYENIEEFKMN
jgi:hypothetical protein